jgi:circadian clock protein KaiC
MTYLIRGEMHGETTETGISSLMDTWISMSNPEFNGERNRLLSVLKSRGMPHSNQVREMLLTQHGIALLEPYLGPSGAVTGAARKSLEAIEKAFAVEREIKLLRKKKDLENSRDLTEARIKMLRSRLQTQEQALQLEISQAKSLEQVKVEDRTRMGATRSPAPEHKTQEQR